MTEEKDHLPTKLDDGVDNSLINREWIEDILSSNIVPYLDEIIITQISYQNNRSFYSIEIPKSYRGPHQAYDKKYYKRHNFKSSPMEHYEILDVTNRKNYLPTVIRASISNINRMFYLTIENISSHIVKEVKFAFPENFNWPEVVIACRI